MGYLPQYATGRCYCDNCNGATVQGRKVGKNFMCVKTYNTMKTLEQISKAKDRNKVRMLSVGMADKSTYTKPVDNKLVDNEAAKKLRQLTDLKKWFEDRRKEMTGRCKHCNGKSCKDSNDFFRHSICHLLPKAYFPSVATHEHNWIELCFWGNNCHGNMDNKMLDLTDMNCFDEIVQKFCIIYPDIAKSERKRIPSILMQYIETEK
jgi:hypothetical protein